MKKTFWIAALIIISGAAALFEGCFETKNIADRSGAQLWAENCIRCHNAPAPGEFSNENWDIVGTHMQVRANLSGTEKDKIIAFLKNEPSQ